MCLSCITLLFLSTTILCNDRRKSLKTRPLEARQDPSQSCHPKMESSTDQLPLALLKCVEELKMKLNKSQLTDQEKYNLLKDLQVKPKYFIFSTSYTDRLLAPSKLESLKKHDVAVVHNVIIDLPSEDAEHFTNCEGSIVFNVGKYDKKTLERLLTNLGYCYGIH